MTPLEIPPTTFEEGTMRTLLLTVVLAAMLTTTAAASDYGYIGLFTDEDRTSWCIDVQPYAQFDIYVYCMPSENGIRAAEFSLADMPPTYIFAGNNPGPLVSISMGDVFDGISYGLYLCATDWVLLDVYHILPTAMGPVPIWLEGHGDTGVMSIANCLPGYPIEPAYAYTSVFVNYPPDSPECSGTATEETSWGAIKEMYND